MFSYSNDVYAVDSNVVWVVGGSGILYKSTNSGTDWIHKPTGITSDLHSIHFVNHNVGYTVGEFGKILYTSDGGDNWTEQQGSSTATLYSTIFVNEFKGWIVGYGGTIYKTTNGGVTFIEDGNTQAIQPNSLSLYQNYPNPFNPITKIKYQLSEVGFVSIKIYDVLGNEIATLVNEEKPAGKYEVKFNGAGLSSGIYFYRIKAGSYWSC
jgi:hypothetical protein